MSLLHYPRRLLWASVGVVLAVVAIGFVLDAKGFAGNALAELAGIVVSVLLAVLLVERLVTADRKARWQLVGEATHNTLRFAIVRAALSLYLHLPAPRPPRADPFVMEQAGELANSLQQLSLALRDEARRPLPSSIQPGAVAAGVVPNTRLIAETVLPRLVMIGAEPELVRPIVDLERSVGALEYDVWMSETFGLPPNALLEDMAGIVDSLKEIVVAVDYHGRPLSARA